DAGAAPGRRRHGTDRPEACARAIAPAPPAVRGLRAARLGARGRAERVAGKEGREVRGDADRSHAGTAAAVRDAEGLVQVEMADVGADVAGAAEADHGVHVGAVHVDLPAMPVHDLAQLADALLEDAVG